MTAPDGREEELALERAAVVEHTEAGQRLWRARKYLDAHHELGLAMAARDRVRELERFEEGTAG